MARLHSNDLTVIYYTANVISEWFAENIRFQLKSVIGDAPLISVSKKPIDFGTNICVGNTPRSNANIYRQALTGAKAATTKYIAMAEDDVLYSPEHFKHRSSPGKFAYNVGYWGLYTWSDPPVFSFKGRRNTHSLICERDLFIEAVEERFAKHPDDDKIDPNLFGELGKYDRQLGVTVRETEEFYTHPPNIMFSHESALAFSNLGKRKRLGVMLADRIPYWGTAREIRKMYEI